MKTLRVINTPLVATSYQELSRWVYGRPGSDAPLILDFSNTHIVTMRRHEPDFLAATDTVDYFIPDSMPLTWVLNAKGAGLKDRVYGPEFTRRCLRDSPPEIRHFFLGGSRACLEKLLENLKTQNPALTIAGARNGYFSTEEEEEIIAEILQSRADCIWLGLGTPKQQLFAKKLKTRLPSGVILNVGFAFDVNAGTKPDAPAWMQPLGLTWAYRLLKEPRRLGWRYLKYNSLFLAYLLLHGADSATQRPPSPTA